jgi:addiction module HigA family antidote
MTTKRKPTTPGEMLREEFLVPMGITQAELARHIGCEVKAINRIVNNATALTPDMALKLGMALGTGPEFWLNAQMATSLYDASRRIKRPIKAILPKRRAETA